MQSLTVVAAFVLQVVSNLLSVLGVYGKDTGIVSNENPTYVTPDGPTFAIWGLIYALQALFVLAQLKPSEDIEELLQQPGGITGLSTRDRISLSFIFNALWLPLFGMEMFWSALLVIIFYLITLVDVYKTLNPCNVNTCREYLVYVLPFAMNAGWAIFATAANLFITLGSVGWEDKNGVAGTVPAALLTLVIVTIIVLLVTLAKKDPTWALVAAWASLGIYRTHTMEDPSRFPVKSMSPEIAKVALVAAIIDLIAAAVVLWLRCKGKKEERTSQGDADLNAGIMFESGTFAEYVTIFQSSKHFIVALSFVVSIISNYLSMTGFWGTDFATLSRQNPTYVTPDSITSAIWRVVYSFQAAFVVAQLKPPAAMETLLQQNGNVIQLSARDRASLAFMLNAVWLPLFFNELFLTASIVIVLYLTMLVSVYTTFNPLTVNTWSEFLMYVVPFALNASWLSFGAATNLFIALGKLGWKDSYGVAGTVPAAMLTLAMLTVDAAGMGIAHRDVTWGVVATWGSLGIYRMQTITDGDQFPRHADKASVVQEEISKGFVKATLVWDVELVLNDPAKGKDRFYNMQLLKAKEGEEYWAVQHWGRTGLDGRVHVDGPFGDVQSAKAVFRKKYRMKTGNAWGQLGGSFVEHAGKYKLLNRDAKKEAKGTWQYYLHNEVNGKDIGWYDYEGAAADNMEKYWRQFESNDGLAVRFVQTDYFKYEINFTEMFQTNTKSGMRRVIRRVPAGEEPSAAAPAKIPEPAKPAAPAPESSDDEDEDAGAEVEEEEDEAEEEEEAAADDADAAGAEDAGDDGAEEAPIVGRAPPNVAAAASSAPPSRTAAAKDDAEAETQPADDEMAAETLPMRR